MRVLRLNYFVVRSSTLENRMLVGQVLLIPSIMKKNLKNECLDSKKRVSAKINKISPKQSVQKKSGGAGRGQQGGAGSKSLLVKTSEF